MPHFDDQRDDGGLVVAGGRMPDKGLVDLEGADRKLLERAQRGVAGPEVIDGQAHAVGAQLLEAGYGGDWIGEHAIRVCRRGLAGRFRDVLLQAVVELLVLAIGAEADGDRHHFRAPDRCRRIDLGWPVAGDGATVAAVGEHQNAHARREAAQFEVQLIVDQLAVVQAPGFVLLVRFFTRDVGDLSAVA